MSLNPHQALSQFWHAIKKAAEFSISSPTPPPCLMIFISTLLAIPSATPLGRSFPEHLRSNINQLPLSSRTTSAFGILHEERNRLGVRVQSLFIDLTPVSTG
jgi:hypothetical protein